MNFPNLVNCAVELKLIKSNCFKILAFNLRVESGISESLDKFVRNEVIVPSFISERIKI